jgi:hypothetical protein
MSNLVVSIINGICQRCNTKLPPLKREGNFGGWSIVDCPNKNCDEWFDVQKYIYAGGQKV